MYTSCWSCCANNDTSFSDDRLKSIRSLTLDGCCALLTHNWLGSLRMHIYLSSCLLLWASWALIRSGHYGNSTFEGINRLNNYSWPAYVRQTPLAALPTYAEYERMYADAQFMAPRPPPPPLPPLLPLYGPGAQTPQTPQTPQTLVLVLSPPSPSPPPPVSSPSPPAPQRPPRPPRPPLPRTDVWPLWQSGDRLYPPNLDEWNDTSAWMNLCCSLLIATEVFRFISGTSYWIGILSNEASEPGSHVLTERSGNCGGLFP